MSEPAAPIYNMNKTCTICGNSLPVTEFHKNSSKKDGYCSSCKTCRNARQQRYREEPCFKQEHRRPAYDFMFHCHTCGMGYDIPDEAAECCARLDLHVYKAKPSASKYGDKKRDARDKYRPKHDWANRGNW